ncbi:ATP-binding protein [Paenibacillus thermotolerans]|uniref:ATP-binding protein n=1 Tax=Paenibacillus thermotolerans TaxID=3027807 RepID=UPI0023682FEF|nr:MULTISPECIES: ATP-binding protein [unclassified Paenibacillus]
MAPRDYGAELDSLTARMEQLERLVGQWIDRSGSREGAGSSSGSGSGVYRYSPTSEPAADGHDGLGALFFSGQYNGTNRLRWSPQRKSVDQLLGVDSDKAGKILSAIGNKLRLDIVTAVLHEPLTGPEIVERLNMGTTGQLYHHIKALLGADLLAQEERGGKYYLPPHRTLPFLLLLAACYDLLDTSDYMELFQVRDTPDSYLGRSDDHDPHHLLWAVVENSILEHQAGFCSEINIILQSDHSITVADNGRGIPVQALVGTGSNTSPVQKVLTEMKDHNTSAVVNAPGGIKGINMPVVNALSRTLSVEIRREGKIYRQDYKHGIPQTELMIIGVTQETGTSITFLPEPDIFRTGFDLATLEEKISGIATIFPRLTVHLLP